MRTSDSTSEITEALVLANNDLRNPPKDAKGQVRGNSRYTYASLPAILDAVKPVLTKNGLAAVQEDVTTSEGIGVVTRLLHVSGQWLEFGPLLMPGSTDAQINGSILTYCRRYQLTAALGLAPDEDDDGRSAAASPVGAAPGGSTAKANTGHGSSSQVTRDVDGAEATQVAAPPSPSASDQRTRAVQTRSDQGTRTDGAPAGDVTIAYGEGASSSTPAGAPHYLNRDDQALLKVQYGGITPALKTYKARFGERIGRLADITYEMRDQVEEASK